MREPFFGTVSDETSAIRAAQALADASAADIAARAARELGDRLVIASSFGLEDVALIDMLAQTGVPMPRIVTLDTGRLPEETHALVDRVEARYRVRVETFFPDRVGVEALVRRQGNNGFYTSIEARKACCAARKLEPLARALAGSLAWMTGLRRDQSPTRTGANAVEWDGRVKINPLYAWTLDDVWAYVRAHDVPYNALHDRGYSSIGCAPCTRAVAPGEHERAGRWWWEAADHKECGLHSPRVGALRAARGR